MNRTNIEWCQNPDGTPGYTWNPITGCKNHKDGLCGGQFPCWAFKLANTRLKHVYMADKNIDRFATVGHKSLLNMPDPFDLRFWPEKLAWENGRGKSKGIFVCSMSDLFGIDVPEDWTQQVLDRIKATSQHRYYLLTKQPQNLAKFSPFPDNCYVGVTVTNDRMMKAALDGLYNIEAGKTFISFEPLLGHIDTEAIEAAQYYRWLDWVIIGAQTKPTVMPKIEWVEEIVSAADKAGIPVFLKNSLRNMGDIELQVRQLRQEMPQ